MRFHSKFGITGWVLAFNALIQNYDWLLGHDVTIWRKSSAMLATAVVSLFILKRFFVYWEFDGELLRECRFWRSRRFTPREILRVSGTGYLGPTRPTSLRIDWFDYSTSDTPLKSGHIYADPKKISKFIEALRQFAPEAAFDI